MVSYEGWDHYALVFEKTNDSQNISLVVIWLHFHFISIKMSFSRVIFQMKNESITVNPFHAIGLFFFLHFQGGI